MKHQALFSLKNKNKTISRLSSAEVLIGAIRVNVSRHDLARTEHSLPFCGFISSEPGFRCVGRRKQICKIGSIPKPRNLSFLRHCITD